MLLIGLGYVGLPLAREAVFSGLRVTGYDLNPNVVKTLSSGRSHVGDVPDTDIQAMLAKGFRGSSKLTGIGLSSDYCLCRPGGHGG